MVSFQPPWKVYKIISFLMFPWGYRERTWTWISLVYQILFNPFVLRLLLRFSARIKLTPTTFVDFCYVSKHILKVFKGSSLHFLRQCTVLLKKLNIPFLLYWTWGRKNETFPHNFRDLWTLALFHPNH